MPLLVALILIVLAIVALVPLSIVMRYRVGTSRRRARAWVITLNATGITLSVIVFLAGAALTNIWVPDAFAYAGTGLAIGCALGALGLWLTHWESARGSLYYTPNRFLVLLLTLVVVARLFYGVWRAWHAWRAGLEGASWAAASGVAGSLAAGAIVLGYYLLYWIGVRQRVRSVRIQHQRL